MSRFEAYRSSDFKYIISVYINSKREVYGTLFIYKILSFQTQIEVNQIFKVIQVGIRNLTIVRVLTDKPKKKYKDIHTLNPIAVSVTEYFAIWFDCDPIQ